MTSVHEPSTSHGRRGGRPLHILGVAVFLALAAAFVYANRTDVPAALRATRAADPRWLAVAVALSAGLLLNLAGLLRASYRAMGLAAPLRTLLRLAAAAQFANTVSKSGGMGGLALVLRDAVRCGWSQGRVVSAYVLANLLGHIAFAVVLLGAFAVIWWDGRLNAPELAAAAIFAAYLTLYTLLLVAAARSRPAVRLLYALPRRLGRALKALAGRPVCDEQGGHEAADELHDAVRVLLRRPAAVLLPGLHALLTELLGVTMVWVVLRAFGLSISPAAPLAGYGISVLFSIVGVLPAGLGVAEASLGAVFISFGVPGATAAVAVLTYRLFEMWLPMLFGAWAAQSVARDRGGR